MGKTQYSAAGAALDRYGPWDRKENVILCIYILVEMPLARLSTVYSLHGNVLSCVILQMKFTDGVGRALSVLYSPSLQHFYVSLSLPLSLCLSVTSLKNTH